MDYIWHDFEVRKKYQGEEANERSKRERERERERGGSKRKRLLDRNKSERL